MQDNIPKINNFFNNFLGSFSLSFLYTNKPTKYTGKNVIINRNITFIFSLSFLLIIAHKQKKDYINSLYLYTFSIIPPPIHSSPLYSTQNCPGVTALASV